MKKIRDFFSRIFGRNDKTNKTQPKTNAKKVSKQPKTNQNKGKSVEKVSPKQMKVSPAKYPREKSSVFASRLTPLNGMSSNERIFDVCAYVILCVKHNKIALSIEEKTGFVWLPFVSISATKTWTGGAVDGAYIVLSNGDANNLINLKSRLSLDWHLMQIFRLQLPQTQIFNIRLIYWVKIDTTNTGIKCCTDTRRLKWFDRTDIIQDKVDNLWGPEVKKYCEACTGPKVSEIQEYSLDQAFFYVPQDRPRNLEEDLLRSANYTEKDVERIYDDFIEHCFPSFNMSLTSFTDYMLKYGFESNEQKIGRLFSAFNFFNTGYLEFSEFLLGLTSIEPNTFNGQSRIKLVFKYFSPKRTGFLSRQQFEEMIRQIYPKDTDKQIKRRVDGSMKRIGMTKDGVAFEDFFKACGNHTFRGTSGLCRSRHRIVTRISASMAARSLARTAKPAKVLTKGFKNILSETQYKGICKSCKEKRYDFALHIVKLDREGHFLESKLLPNWDRFERPEKSDSEKSVKNNSLSGSSVISLSESSVEQSNSSPSLLNMSIDMFAKEYTFNPKFAANFLIKKIREFNDKKGLHKDNKGLMDAIHERPELVSKLEQLCKEVQRIFSAEDRCVEISAPAFVIGDIHGNLEDLLTMEKVLWKNIPIVSANYLFLGDYVDRGKWSVECCIYVLCLKMLAPTKVFVLRGNHEVRDLQIHYTYKKECIRKYGENHGKKVFDMTNRVFDKLPVCAVIDDSVFCAHGGIPRNTRKIDDINREKVDIKNPERESAIVWQILWSDPIGGQQFKETAELLQVKVEDARGFLTNTKRGTAYLFSEEAVNNFLQTNGLTHIVRAHEVPARGYQFHFGNKCTTIFSCSHYCGTDNEAACVHVDQQKLRIIRLDTKNNAPASD